MPEAGEPVTKGTLKVSVERREVNVIDAAAAGASQGLYLALNIAAMLVAFIAMIALVNAGVGWVGGWFGHPDLSLQTLLGWALAPLAWLMGVSWADATTVGSLLGVKTILNEFVAYLQLTGILQSNAALSPRAAIIAAYALCGFANLATIAIQIGGLGGIAPERRGDLSRLGLLAMIGGNLATFMSASLAGMLL